jgi:hypothetical protein
LSPTLLKKQLNITSFVNHQKKVEEVRTKMVNTLQKSLLQVKMSNIESAKKLNSSIAELKRTTTTIEAEKIYNQITADCIREHSVVFKQSISNTVRKVMSEVGYSTIVVKHISNTPVIIVKNNIGQTIRTEINEASSDGKINLVRIQSGIPESECTSLNQRINEGFIKNGLNFTRFNIMGKEQKPKHRTFDFSENSDVSNTQINQPLKTNL